MLVRRRPLSRRLLQLPRWQELASAFASRQPVLTQLLAPKLQRSLSYSLCLATDGFESDDAAPQYITQVRRVRQHNRLSHMCDARRISGIRR